MPLTRHAIQPVRVANIAQIETYRQIRNEAPNCYARNRCATTKEEQAAWWRAHAANLRAWLYETSRGRVVGIGSLHEHDGRVWAFVAVTMKERYQGYGTDILRDLARQANGQEIWADVLSDNIGALEIHERAGGWSMVRESNGIITMVHRGARA